MDNIHIVLRRKKDWADLELGIRKLDKDNAHDVMLEEHFVLLKQMGINYWKVRSALCELAYTCLQRANFKSIIHNLPDFASRVSELEGDWIFFTDDDDWVDETIIAECTEVIKMNPDVSAVIWKHCRYHFMSNSITGPDLKHDWVSNPLLQTNHCIIKIDENFLKWNLKDGVEEKAQHWNLSEYIYDSKKIKYIEVDKVLSMWNNSFLSFTWKGHHGDVWNLDHLHNLKIALKNYTDTLPMNYKYLTKTNKNSNLTELVKEQQAIIKELIYEKDSISTPV